VTSPAATGKTYLYNDTNDPHNLTGIINEKGIQSLTVGYDDQDRALFSEHAGGMGRIDVQYYNNYVRHVTDSRGNTTDYDLYVAHGIGRVESSTGGSCTSCAGGGAANFTLNDRLRIEDKTDAMGYEVYTPSAVLFSDICIIPILIWLPRLHAQAWLVRAKALLHRLPMRQPPAVCLFRRKLGIRKETRFLEPSPIHTMFEARSPAWMVHERT